MSQNLSQICRIFVAKSHKKMRKNKKRREEENVRNRIIQRFADDYAKSQKDIVRISAMFGDAPDSRRERLERFCAGLRFKDGSTALDAFNEQEKQLRAKGKKINR